MTADQIVISKKTEKTIKKENLKDAFENVQICSFNKANWLHIDNCSNMYATENNV